MTQWYLKFKSKDEKIIEFINALNKAKLLEFIELSDKYGKNRKKISFEDLPRIRKITDIKLGWNLYSFLYGPEVKDVNPNTRCTTISVVGADKGLHKYFLDVLKIAGETLEPFEFEVICEEEGPKPIYKGEWSLDIFNKKILPKIEFAKKQNEKI